MDGSIDYTVGSEWCKLHESNLMNLMLTDQDEGFGAAVMVWGRFPWHHPWDVDLER